MYANEYRPTNETAEFSTGSLAKGDEVDILQQEMGTESTNSPELAEEKYEPTNNQKNKQPIRYEAQRKGNRISDVTKMRK